MGDKSRVVANLRINVARLLADRDRVAILCNDIATIAAQAIGTARNRMKAVGNTDMADAFELDRTRILEMRDDILSISKE